MYTQKEVLLRLLQAFGIWPTPEQVAGIDPAETRETISYTIHALDGPHLLVLLWLSSFLLLMQHKL